MSDGLVCSRCGRDRFEEEDGILTCMSCGHRLEGGQQTVEDETFGMKGKVIRKKEEKKKVKISKVLRGAKGRKLYLQAWQYILWKQCYDLIHSSKTLSEKLWVVVKDLWTLCLSKLANFLEERKSVDQVEKPNLPEVQTASDFEPDIQEKIETFHGRLPRLWDSIATNYLGIILLQYPLTLATLYEFILKEQICFIRAIRSVPEEMLIRLPQEFRNSLDTTVIPKPEDLQEAVIDMISIYEHGFGMKFPGINWLPILYQHIETLAVPIEVFLTVKHLSMFLGQNFSYQVADNTHKTVARSPETTLMALIVIATKLLFPFDSKTAKFCPYSLNEPAALELDWEQWQMMKNDQAQQQVNETKDGNAIYVKDTDIFNMTPEELDEYMDWYQKTWTQTDVGSEVQQSIVDMFPLKTIEEQPMTEKKDIVSPLSMNKRLNRMQESLRAREAIPEEELMEEQIPVLRPGQRHFQYRSVSDLEGVALSFHEDAAKYACVSLKTLLLAVVRLESRLLKLQHEQRRAEFFGYDLHDDAATLRTYTSP